MEQAAGGYPIPGDIWLYEEELVCQEGLETPGYYKSLNGAEIADGHRSGHFPCWSFTGSWDDANKVFAHKSDDEHIGAYYLNNRKPGELFLAGGGTPTDQNVPQAPFVAKVDPSSGRTIWKTYLGNPPIQNFWNANSNLNILENGKIVFMWSTRVALIDPDTGRILRVSAELPSGNAHRQDVNFKHLTVAPDGTLILKNQNRPTGCTFQGTLAITLCLQEGMTQAASHLVALDPDTLEILDDIDLPRSASSPHIVTTWEDRIAVYFADDTSLMRVWWDPEKKALTLDEDFQIVTQLAGQSTGTAPTLMGDWLVVQNNGNGSYETASSLVAVHQGDPSRIERIQPHGQLDVANGEWSYAPPKAGSDPENNMVFSSDMGMGSVAAVYIDPESGKMELAYLLEDMNNTFQPTFGPKDRRILITSDMVLDDPSQKLQDAYFKQAYSEVLRWREAATGRLLAESDPMEPLLPNALFTPGYGGRIYFPTVDGRFYILQVKPADTR